MVLVTLNSDTSDSWEREGDNPEFFFLFSSEGYGLDRRPLQLAARLVVRPGIEAWAAVGAGPKTKAGRLRRTRTGMIESAATQDVPMAIGMRIPNRRTPG